MSADRETTRIVRSWLDEGVTSLPDRVLDAVLDRVPATPQRRSLWPPRRFAHMNRFAPAAIAAAALLVVAVVGYSVLPRVGGPGGPETPSPTPLPTSRSSASPSLIPPLPGSGALEPGTYMVTSYTNLPLTLAVPVGWAHEDGNFISKGNAFDGNGVALAFWQVSHVYAQSCDWEGTLVPVDSAEAIVTELLAQEGHDTSAATDVTLGGEPASRIEFGLDASFDISACDREIVRLWPDAGPREQFGLPIYPGQAMVAYVVDHGERSTLVVAIRNDDSPATDAEELNELVASIRFIR